MAVWPGRLVKKTSSQPEGEDFDPKCASLKMIIREGEAPP